jgi:hypothetical protein
MSDLLLSLWEEGWEPMTPIDMAAKEKYVLLLLTFPIINQEVAKIKTILCRLKTASYKLKPAKQCCGSGASRRLKVTVICLSEPESKLLITHPGRTIFIKDLKKFYRKSHGCINLRKEAPKSKEGIFKVPK